MADQNKTEIKVAFYRLRRDGLPDGRPSCKSRKRGDGMQPHYLRQ